MRISDWSSDVCSSDLARIDRWQIKNGGIREWTLATEDSLRGESFADRSHWEPTGRAAIAWQPASALTLRAAGYFSHRLPTLNELYRRSEEHTPALPSIMRIPYDALFLETKYTPK